MFISFQGPQFGPNSKLPDGYICQHIQLVPNNKYLPEGQIPFQLDKFGSVPPMLVDIDANGVVIGFRIPIKIEDLNNFQVSSIPPQFWNMLNLDTQILAKELVQKPEGHADLDWDTIAGLTAHGKNPQPKISGLPPIPGLED